MKKKIILLFPIVIVLLVLVFSVGHKRNNSSTNAEKECKTFNDSAIVILSNIVPKTGDQKELDVVLQMLDQAIDCDSNYFLAYANKSSVLILKKDYINVIKVLNKMITLTDNDPELVGYKGMIFEKLGQIDSAQNVYNIAEQLYKDKLKLYPDSIQIIVDKLFFIAFRSGKQKALAELDDYSNKYPNDDLLLGIKEIIENFNKEDFLNNLGQTPPFAQ